MYHPIQHPTGRLPRAEGPEFLPLTPSLVQGPSRRTLQAHRADSLRPSLRYEYLAKCITNPTYLSSCISFLPAGRPLEHDSLRQDTPHSGPHRAGQELPEHHEAQIARLVRRGLSRFILTPGDP